MEAYFVVYLKIETVDGHTSVCKSLTKESKMAFADIKLLGLRRDIKMICKPVLANTVEKGFREKNKQMGSKSCLIGLNFVYSGHRESGTKASAF